MPKTTTIHTRLKGGAHLKTGGQARLAWWRAAAAAMLGLILVAFPLAAGENRSVAAPNLANYYQDWSLTESKVQELAKWDVVILEMENQARNPELMRKLRELNPKIIILAYITAQEIRQDAANGPSQLRQKLASGIRSEWYLYDAQGKRMSYWPGTDLLNVSDRSPVVNGQRFTDYLSLFVANTILSTGLWDGVFYDNGWAGVNWFAKDRADLDRDGVADKNVDASWVSGMEDLFNETRRVSGNNYLITSNEGPGNREYRDQLNGIMLETFPSFGWKYTMEVYDYHAGGARRPQILIINANTHNTGKKDDYRTMRYGLASTLLGDNGYYSFDYGDQTHAQTWWYDEYDVQLGNPVGTPVSAANKNKFDEDVWKREYTNGVAIVNATNQPQKIELGAEYEKIIGTQDKTVNDGSITDRVTLAPKDGLIMLKTFQKITDSVFQNGAFLRFYTDTGGRSRNGFFAFEEGVPGGALLYQGDLNGDGQEERVITKGPSIAAYSVAGTKLFEQFPFGKTFKGKLRFALGKLFPKAPGKQIIISADQGGKVVMYSATGAVMQAGFYPYGTKYNGGLSVAIGNVDGGNDSEIIIGTGRGRGAEVIVYDQRFAKVKKRFTAYGSGYSNGILVAVGDLAGNGQEKIITLPQRGTPMVKLFTGAGKKITEFKITGLFGGDRLDLSSSDVNADGKREIVVMSAQ